MTSVVLICPETDQVEQIMAAAWADGFQLQAPPAASITSLRGAAATHSGVSGAMATGTGLFFFGHGKTDCLGDPTVVIDAANVGGAAGALIVAFACFSALDLGPESIRQQIETYIGFDDLLPVYGPPANAVTDAVVDALSHLASGGTATDAYNRLEKGLAHVVQEHIYGPSRRDPNAPLIFTTARLMQRSLTICGNGSYTLP